MNKDKTFPGVKCNWSEAERLFVKVKKVLFIGNKMECAFTCIRPAVELAGESLAVARVIPNNLIAPMGADIMEGSNLTVLAPCNQDGGATYRQFFDKIVSSVGDVINPTNIKPELAEDFFAL